ncbi:MAG: phosphatase [Oscillospiraceae bacterium]|nr:phosphatase [Oscillospiraceae bacterium]
MKIIADTHTHTVASTHAYSTLLENVTYAKKIGLRILGNTDHGPAIAGGPQVWYFHNEVAFPEVIDGVIVLKGAEANILDYDGNLDLTQNELNKLDWVIASMHSPVINSGTVEDHTRAYLAVAQNPAVDVIGHSGDGRFPYDYERVIKAFKEYGKIVEINNHSFVTRAGSKENCTQIAKLCKKYQVPVVVNSDAHFCTEIGHFPHCIAMLEEIDFPEELVVNADFDRFLAIVKEKSGRDFTQEITPW